ncbi:MAG: PadR family transcriptional regulator [Candidatus Gastranaerophilales bacterium]|nr:PadR family transcriptional regulator [Candidatus Gastranaerophilales bacterium]
MIELLILYVLSEKELTMYAVLKHILSVFGAYTQPSFGAVKPALNRLEKAGFIRSRKAMSDGGKLSGFYSVTTEGREELKELILEKISDNPLQFQSTSGVKICCASYLAKDEREKLFNMLKNKAQEHKFTAENILNNEKLLTFYQRIMLDNTIVEYKNLITLIENLEKDNARNSQ